MVKSVTMVMGNKISFRGTKLAQTSGMKKNREKERVK